MATLRVVVSVHTPPVWTMPPSQIERIARSLPGVDVVDARSEAERAREFPGADVLLTPALTSEEFRRAAEVRWIHSSAVGVGGLLRPEVVESDVVVTNARGLHADAIAEHAIAMMLSLRRGLHTAAARQAVGSWAQVEFTTRPIPPLGSTRLLVVGLGEIGTRVARLALGLGMRVSAVRRRPEAPAPEGVDSVFGADRLGDLLPDADVVVLAVPRTDSTKTLFGAAEFALMRRSAMIINVARGNLIDEAALEDALESGRIAGAGLDAFPREPLSSDSPWWTMPNLMVTPHMAAFDGDYWTPVVDLFLENMDRFRAGEPLRNVVDKQRGY